MARQQAALYAGWLGRLAAAMHAEGKTVGAWLSDWGILQYYDLYGAASHPGGEVIDAPPCIFP